MQDNIIDGAQLTDGAQGSQARRKPRKMSAEELQDLLNKRKPVASKVFVKFYKLLQWEFPDAILSSFMSWPEHRDLLEWDKTVDCFLQTKVNPTRPNLMEPLLILPVAIQAGCFCLVIRERFEDGRVKYLMMDPQVEAHEGTACEVQRRFKLTERQSDQGSESLWNSEPGMTEWQSIQIPQSGTGCDERPIASACLAMYLSLRRQRPTLFHGKEESIKFATQVCIKDIGSWAREWMHQSLVEGRLQRIGVNEAMTTLCTDSGGIQTELKAHNNKKKKRRKRK
jgi:hypothetical protein